MKVRYFLAPKKITQLISAEDGWKEGKINCSLKLLIFLFKSSEQCKTSLECGNRVPSVETGK